MDLQAILEALDDLKHDLGKYLVMPVAMLEPGAAPEQVRDAVAQALLRTRVGPSGTSSAADLWQAFQLEVGDGPDARDALAPLARSVDRALDWQAALAAGSAVDRQAVLADFRAVSVAIDGVVAALSGDAPGLPADADRAEA